MGKDFTREEAFELLKEHNKTDSLIKHGLAVEGVMRHFAELLGEDTDKWGVVGLLHDLDYEKYPDQHCVKVVELLKDADAGDELIHAVCSHGYGLCSDVKPEHTMELVLYAIDELTGLINAVAIMRPSKSVADLEYKSVQKKYKQLNFAAGVDRGVIESGCAMLNERLGNIDLKYLIEETINGMRRVAESIGL